MSYRAFVASLAALLMVGACENNPADPPGTDAAIPPGTDAAIPPGTDAAIPPGTDGGPRADGGPAPGSYSLTFGPILGVPAGTENTQCVVVRLGNVEQLRVGSIHNVLGEGSHHFIVYRTNDTVEQTTPFDCDPFVDTLDPAAGSPLMITQRSEETLQLPPGVAFTLEPNQMIRLEMHYVNFTGSTTDIGATATFNPIPPGEYMHEADFLFIGNPDIDIPPRSTQTLGPTFFRLPSEFAGVNFFGITGHTHQYGTNVRIWNSMSAADTTSPVYDIPGWSWDEPETEYFDPAFQVPSGGGFRFTCEYNNTSSSRVGFGESANQEMCFFWAYYYPSRGAFVCAHTDRVPGGFDLCCPGSPLCSMLF